MSTSFLLFFATSARAGNYEEAMCYTTFCGTGFDKRSGNNYLGTNELHNFANTMTHASQIIKNLSILAKVLIVLKPEVAMF